MSKQPNSKKTYSSVLQLVQAISTPKLAQEFKKRLAKKVVYICLSATSNVEVFSSLSVAKQYALAHYGALQAYAKGSGLWFYEDGFVQKKKIRVI